jgi:hypothetical protein
MCFRTTGIIAINQATTLKGINIVCKSGFLDFAHHLYFNKITFQKLDLLPRILGSHSGEYEDGCLLSCSAV